MGIASLALSVTAVALIGQDTALTIAFGLLAVGLATVAFFIVDTRRSVLAETSALRAETKALRAETKAARAEIRALPEAASRQVRMAVGKERSRSEKRDLKEVRRWRDALWAGHDSAAIDRLWQIGMDHAVSTTARGQSLLVLTKWYVVEGDLERAYEHVVLARITCPPLATEFEQPALEADILCAMGRQAEARELLHGLPYAEDPNLLLRLANTYVDGNNEDTRLGLINQVYVPSGFAPLAKLHPALPMTIDNVRTVTCSTDTADITVSVIVPAYNAQETVEHALRSLREQTWSNLEIIVVDDGSDDQTASIVKGVADDDPRITLVQQDRNRGAYAARNVGLRVSTGQVVTTHDADDWSHAERIETQMRALQADNKLVGTVAHATRVTHELVARPLGRPTLRLVSLNYASLMVRREVFDAVGEWDPIRASADSEFMSRVMAYYGSEALPKIAPDVPLMFARVTPGSLTRASETSIFTVWEEGGARRRYQKAYQGWHASNGFADDLPWLPDLHPRPFECPDVLLGTNGRFEVPHTGQPESSPRGA